MTTINPVLIPFSRTKTFMWLIGATAFVALGGWLLFGNPVFHNALLDNPLYTRIVGAASFLFFGIAAYFFGRNLMAKGPGLIIDDMGIEDFSSAAAIKIYWKDIKGIETLTIQSQPIILVKVGNPQTYIDQAKGFKRKMMETNYKWYDAPISISANGLRISFEELLELVSDRFECYANTIR